MTHATAKLADRLIDVATGLATPSTIAAERRRKRRLPFQHRVVLVLIGPTGHCSEPMVMYGYNLSYDGMCVISRSMVYEKSVGAVQMLRSNGEMAIVGVQVRYCRYVGAMKHHVGLKFVPLTQQLRPSAFLDDKGRMILLDESLKGN